MKPEAIIAGRTYELQGLADTKGGLTLVTVTRKVIEIQGDKIIFDKDGTPSESDLETFARLAVCEE